MIGAIIGDIIGSTYEFIDNVKDKNFELFVPYSMTTDDSIMSLAVGQALVNTYKEKDVIKIQNETCQVIVPISIQAFLEGEDFEDVLKTAIYAGGDTDTIACMACSIAEAYYEISDKFLNFCYPKISINLKEALKNFLILVKRENRLNNNLEKVLKLLESEK